LQRYFSSYSGSYAGVIPSSIFRQYFVNFLSCLAHSTSLISRC
jgi:hypothetical protein